MSSKIVLKNNIGTEGTLSHKDGDEACEVSLDELRKTIDNIKPVDTIADLRTMITSYDSIWVSGYHTAGDGAFGSNIFAWDATSTEDDNNGTIIKLDSFSIGRYKLQYEGIIRKSWFGEEEKYENLGTKQVYKIAVMGDSITQNSLYRIESWTSILEKFLNQTNKSDYYFEIKNFAVGGSSFYNSNNINELYDGTTLTSDAVIEYAPNQILIAMGYNDCYTRGLSYEDTISEVDALLLKLKTALPLVYIELIKQFPWDSQAGIPESVDNQSEVEMTNKSIVPGLHYQDSIELGGVEYKERSNTQAYMDKKVFWTKNNSMAKLALVHNYFNTLADGDTKISSRSRQDIFRACRLGWHVDGLHPNSNGHKLFAADIMKAMRDFPGSFQYKFGFLSTARENDGMFDSVEFWREVVNSNVASGWDRAYSLNSLITDYGKYDGASILKTFNNWFIPNEREFSWALQNECHNASSPVTWMLDGIPSQTAILRLYEPTGDWSGTRLFYDSTGYYHGITDKFVHTWVPNLMFPYSMNASGTYDVGILVQNARLYPYEVIRIMGTLKIG